MPLAAVVLILGFAARALASFPCPGDCRDDGRVSIDELITGVNIALGSSAVDVCAPLDLNGDGVVAINELITAVNRALGTCFDATVALPGLPGPTDVVYDSFGIPHIYGPDLNSVAFAQGYVQAAHRFWKMNLSRHWAEGRLTEIFGIFTLQADTAMRALLTTRDGRRMEEALWERIQATDPEIAAQLEAYADGVNAWLADLRAGRNGATLPPEYGLLQMGPDDLPPWRPQDTVAFDTAAWWDMDSWILNDTLSYAELSETLDEATHEDVFRSAPSVYVHRGIVPQRGVAVRALGPHAHATFPSPSVSHSASPVPGISPHGTVPAGR
ncbi:MAG TPA: penicillin acylase family protein, partial [Candidatus Dormibacteraeota bacterium]|nr:penicillin acylase family protein [Candidatus Dormibacteraeota bacterium]